MKALIYTTLSLFVLGSNTCLALTHTLSGPMDVFQATTNPANVGNGTGTISGDYDETTNTLNYTLTWQDLTSTVTNMHFHLGAPGVPGGVELGIPGPWSSPQVGSGIILDATQETNLLAGNWYVNVHTSNFGGGEIRGQVNVTLIPEPTTLGLASLAFCGLASCYRRRR